MGKEGWLWGKVHVPRCQSDRQPPSCHLLPQEYPGSSQGQSHHTPGGLFQTQLLTLVQGVGQAWVPCKRQKTEASPASSFMKRFDWCPPRNSSKAVVKLSSQGRPQSSKIYQYDKVPLPLNRVEDSFTSILITTSHGYYWGNLLVQVHKSHSSMCQRRDGNASCPCDGGHPVGEVCSQVVLVTSWHLVHNPSSEKFPGWSTHGAEVLTGQTLENYPGDFLAVPLTLENLEKNVFLWGLPKG